MGQGQSLPEKNKPNNHRINLAEGPVHRHLIRMMLPMMVGISASMGFVLVDTYFISQLGAAELAAIGFVSPIVMVIVASSIGLSAGTSSIMARAAGSDDHDELVRLATNSFLISVLFSLIFTLAGLLTIDPLFTAMGADEAALPLIRDYMRVWYWSPLFIIVPMVAMGIMRALGDTSLQGKVMILAALANAALDPIMIFGLFGFPRLEMSGAALATLITRAGSFIAVMYYLTYRFQVIKFSPDVLRAFKASLRKIMHVGLPAMGTNMIIPIAGGVVISVIATFGNDAVAGTNLAIRIESVTIIVFYALSAVIGPFAGQNLGARQYDRIEKSLQQCALFALIGGGLLAAVIALAAPYITMLFGDDQAIHDLANSYLYIVPISYGAYGFVMTANATFNGLGRPLPGVLVSLLRVVIFQIPLVLGAAFYLADLKYVFIATSLSNILAGLIAYVWVIRTVRELAPPLSAEQVKQEQPAA